jgi:asparagine synthetase B (glutamine-hydrolysing)
MIERASSAAISEPIDRPNPATDWVLTIGVDASGRATATGVPFVERGPYRVFCDGLIHDRAELAEKAELPPNRPSAELIAAAYERRGDALIAELRGNFAVAIVNLAENSVTVARDPVGSHPVYYTETGATFRVAKYQQALLALPDVSRRLNRAVLADDICQRWPAADETYYESIRRVPPGCRFLLDQRGPRVVRHWNRLADPVDYLSEADADRFEDALTRAVRRSFEGGRPGIFLSGGFDSVSVAAVATDYARRSSQVEPVALSLGFPHPDCDETIVQRSVAKRLGLQHELLHFHEATGTASVFDKALDLNKSLAAPLYNPWSPAYLALARRGHRAGVRTIVTGDGGDEWLNVSPYLTADLIRKGDVGGIVRMARTWHRSFASEWHDVLTGTLWTFGVRPLIGSFLASINPAAWDRRRARLRVSSDPAWITPDPALRAEQARRAGRNMVEARPKGGFYNRELRKFLNEPLMASLFEEQYELGEQIGVRYSHPYWDPDLVEHMYRTPPDVLTRGNRTKGLVRAAVDARFPGLGFKSAKKVVAFAFFVDLATKEFARAARPFADFAALGELGVVDPVRARASLEASYGRPGRVMWDAWHLVAVEAWARAQLKANYT